MSARRESGKRRLNGEGTVFEENDPRRRTTHRAEIDVRLPNGVVKRVIARGVGAQDARAKLASKVRRFTESHPDAERMTLRAFLERWLDHKRATVRPSTIATYERDVGHVTRRIGDVKLNRVTPREVQEVITALVKDGHAPQADKVRRTLKQALKQAVRWELLTRNPADAIDPVPTDPTERAALTPYQVSVLLEVTRGLRLHGLWALAIHSGLRIGELLALTWGDVADDGVTVRRTVSEGGKDGYAPPKTRAGRRNVPVAPEVVALLGKRGRANELVFRTSQGTPQQQRAVAHALDRAVTKANKRLRALKAPDEALLPRLRPHDLRRTYATLQAASGTHPRVIQALLGHATPTLAMTVYTDALREQVEASRFVWWSGGGSGSN